MPFSQFLEERGSYFRSSVQDSTTHQPVCLACSLWIMASGFVKADLSTCRHGGPQVTCRLLYKSVLLLVFGLIIWKWVNGVDSLGSNQECRIGYKHSYSRVSQCLANIRKLGNRRSSEGLRSFKRSKETNLFVLIILAGDIEINPGPRFQGGLCKKYCKASDRLLECEECEKRFHASCSNLADDELLRTDLVTELGIAQTVKLTVVFTVVLP